MPYTPGAHDAGCVVFGQYGNSIVKREPAERLESESNRVVYGETNQEEDRVDVDDEPDVERELVIAEAPTPVAPKLEQPQPGDQSADAFQPASIINQQT